MWPWWDPGLRGGKILLPGSELGCPALSICARKGSRVGAFGWRVPG